MNLEDTFKVTKLYINNGQFPSGIVQYFYTYVNSYRQESNFVRVSPLYYSTFEGRGGSPTESTTSAFKIDITGIEGSINKFDYLRLYSTIRTSLNATPVAKKVVDIPIIYKLNPITSNTININSTTSDSVLTFYNNITSYNTTSGLYYNRMPMYITRSTDNNGNKVRLYISNDSKFMGEYWTNTSTTPSTISNLLFSTEYENYYTGGVVYDYSFYIDLNTQVSNLEDNTENKGIIINSLTKANKYTYVPGAYTDGDSSWEYVYITNTPFSAYPTINFTSLQVYADVYNFSSLKLYNSDRTSYTSIDNSTNTLVVLRTKELRGSSYINTYHIYDTINNVFLWRVDSTSTTLVPVTNTINSITYDSIHTLTFTDGTIGTSDTWVKALDSNGSPLLKEYIIQNNDILEIKGLNDEINTIDNFTFNSNICSTTNITFTSIDTNYPITCNYGGNNFTSYNTINIPYQNIFTSTTIKWTYTYNGSISYIDNNTTGETVDITSLLYKENSPFTENSIISKDNTLFLGNYTLLKSVYELEQSSIKDSAEITYELNYNDSTIDTKNSIYGYNVNLNSPSFSDNSSEGSCTYKSREWYRHGVQFQLKNGCWTEPFFVGDKKVDVLPNSTYLENNDGTVKYSTIIAKLNITIPDSLKNKVSRIRPVIVYPEFKDKSIITQGIICPTVYNGVDRKNNLPASYSSWFFRPVMGGQHFQNLQSTRYVEYNNMYSGIYSVFKHGSSLPMYLNYNCEILGSSKYYSTPIDTFDITRKEIFFVDQNILTLHTPELYYETLPDLSGLKNLKFRVIGISAITSSDSNSYLTTSTLQCSKYGVGFIKTPVGTISPTNSLETGIKGSMQLATACWNDSNAYNTSATPVNHVAYPWHRTLCIGNDKSAADTLHNKISKKSLINIRNSFYNLYTTDSNIVKYNDNISIDYFNNSEVVPLLLKGKFNGLNRTVYSGNVDKAVICGRQYWGTKAGTNTPEFVDTVPDGDTDPIPIQYKSSPHAVIQLQSTTNSQFIAPYVTFNKESFANVYGKYTNGDIKPFWGTDTLNISQYKLHIDNEYVNDGSTSLRALDSYLLLGEIYREDEDVINRFGGNTTEALQNNKWVPNGPSINIDSSVSNITITSFGDSYYQRFDCLKTYPLSNDNTQTVTEILSFMCETSINLDAIYSKNRGSVSTLMPQYGDYNKRNEVYDQSNNFQYYYIPNYDLFNIDTFPNSFTYSKTKIAGEFIDTWTNLTLASTLDCNGVLGNLRALKLFNNTLIGFQDRGIFQILFNSNVQINSTTGLPIEIANSGKVEGIRYLSSQIGTSNKWSIAESTNGLYFIDNISTGIYLFNGQIKNLTSDLGFFSWLNNIDTTEESWTPTTFGTFRGFYDITNNDVYFTNKDTCLVYSETMGQFTSFYSYEKVPFMFTFKGDFYSINKIYNDTTTKLNIWKQNKGLYNSFYGQNKPYYITYIVNPDMPKDKIFNNIEYRSDIFDSLGNLIIGSTFDTLSVWNEYQSGESNLHDIQLYPANLKQKFRVWRANIPRVTSITTTSRLGDSNKILGMDRLRNPWTYLKITNNATTNNRQVLHDLNVNYTL